MQRFLTALWLRALDILKAKGSAPYEIYNAQGTGYVAVYKLEYALTAADAPDGTKVGRIPVWINGVRHTFQFDKLNRRRLPQALRARLFR